MKTRKPWTYMTIIEIAAIVLAVVIIIGTTAVFLSSSAHASERFSARDLLRESGANYAELSVERTEIIEFIRAHELFSLTLAVRPEVYDMIVHLRGDCAESAMTVYYGPIGARQVGYLCVTP